MVALFKVGNKLLSQALKIGSPILLERTLVTMFGTSMTAYR